MTDAQDSATPLTDTEVEQFRKSFKAVVLGSPLTINGEKVVALAPKPVFELLATIAALRAQLTAAVEVLDERYDLARQNECGISGDDYFTIRKALSAQATPATKGGKLYG